jgi:hypothetical protein
MRQPRGAGSSDRFTCPQGRHDPFLEFVMIAVSHLIGDAHKNCDCRYQDEEIKPYQRLYRSKAITPGIESRTHVKSLPSGLVDQLKEYVAGLCAIAAALCEPSPTGRFPLLSVAGRCVVAGLVRHT